ncbi:PREDICTED: uncharacterized protein LOC106819278 isoform X1 [Priapulus caudatus]|uniref:Uncharacterized protein LOC106819278 isoform X1 n=1 Tax=Priapulus caudatus TaxID=37621 RepID=A0ABM1F4N9_PRICU|nr:PREDICTED: uncharacterized protein LOC106819278 isoform X1 [Priapulus caudatus]
MRCLLALEESCQRQLHVYIVQAIALQSCGDVEDGPHSLSQRGPATGDELQKAKTVIMPVNVGNSTTGHFGAFLRGKSLRKGTWCVEDVGRQTQKDTSSCGVFICKGVNRVQC